MNRWLVCFAVVMVGCVATLPDDDSVTADFACETARAVVQMRQSMPPSPAPNAGECENCNGTGKIGDGRIVLTCPACRGTGRTP